MLKVKDKRCMLVVSSQQFNGTGGVGTSTSALCRMLYEIGYAVDIVMDKRPNKAHKAFAESITAYCGLFYPEEALSYNKHHNTFAFRDSLIMEQLVNFRLGIMSALKGRVYDLCIVQTTDAISPVFHLELQNYMTVVFYSHEYNSVFYSGSRDPVYNTAYRPWQRTMMTLPNVIVGTQTEENVVKLKANGILSAVCLPLPITEPQLFDSPNVSYIDKKGVLFIGRWEPRKDPKAYVKMIKETNLPARVMTSIKSKDKFIEAFKEAGITDYVVKANLKGQAKVDFIHSTRCCYMPSKEESYGLVVYEAVASQPVITLNNYEWSKHHKWSQHYRVDRSDVNEVVKKLYNTDANSRQECTQHENTIKDIWRALPITKAPSNPNNFNKEATNGWVIEYNEGLGRRFTIEDHQSIQSSKYKFLHTKNNTWYHNNGTAPKQEPIHLNNSKVNENFQNFFEEDIFIEDEADLD